MTFGHDVFGAGERTGHADPNLIWEWFPTSDQGSGGSWHVTGYTPCDPLDPACVSHSLTHDNGGNGNGGSTPQEQDTGGEQSNGWEDQEEQEEEQHEEHPPHHGDDSSSPDTVSAAESWYATPEGRAPIIKAVMGTALVIWGATALVDMYQGRWMK